MTAVIHMDKGEPLRFQLTWRDDEGPIDFTGFTVGLLESFPPEINGTVEIIDAAQGTARVVIPADAPWALGSANWIRLGLLKDGEVEDAMPRLWVNVQ